MGYLTPETAEEFQVVKNVRAMIKRGYSTEATARKLFLSVADVALIRKAKYKALFPGGEKAQTKLNQAARPAILEKLEGGWSARQVADLLDVTIELVHVVASDTGYGTERPMVWLEVPVTCQGCGNKSHYKKCVECIAREGAKRGVPKATEEVQVNCAACRELVYLVDTVGPLCGECHDKQQPTTENGCHADSVA